MSPRDSIENTLARYAWAYDIKQLELIGDCFTEDTQTTFADTGLKVGREAVVSEMIRRRSVYADGEVPWHVLSNVFVVEQRDGLAKVNTFYTLMVAKTGQPPQVRTVGYYEDVFRDDGDKWRIHLRSMRSVGR